MRTLTRWRQSLLTLNSNLVRPAHPHRVFSTTVPAMSGTQGLIAEAFSAAVVSHPKSASAVPSDHPEKAHHLANGKGFDNPWDSWQELGILELLGGIISHRCSIGIAGPRTDKLNHKVVAPTFPATRSTESETFRATWLGHACFYVEFPGGLRVLFDPVFSARCSPVQFMGPKRYTPPPCKIEDIPVVDIVCISHSHYDHLDLATVQDLRKFHPKATYFVPLGIKRWFESLGIKECVEMDWWEEREVELAPSRTAGTTAEVVQGSEGESVKTETEPAEGEGKITARLGLLPCQHTSGRWLTDRAETLWGSWSVSSGGKKVYFAGDTGYRAVPKESYGKDDYAPEYAHLPVCPAFKQIGELRGPFDLGLIPIGAYEPRWVMSAMHTNPKDAVNIFVETKCKKAIGMHWGTWVLTDEPVNEPPIKLREAMAEKGLEETGVFDVLNIGESREY